MKTSSKVIFALCVCLFLVVPPASAQTTSGPEIKQILAAAKNYAKSCSSGGAVDNSELKFVRKVKDCALVNIEPKPKYKGQWEGAGIILKKIGGKWLGQFMGTDDVPMKEICPDLFN